MLFSLHNINKLSPYKFIEVDDDTLCLFTDNSSEYLISFIKDESLGLDNMYQFCITQKTKGDVEIGPDKKIALSIVALLKSFFADQNNILLFVCDNSDKHEAARNRKFTSWFNKYADHSLMEMKSESIDGDGCAFYVSIIYCKTIEDAKNISDVFHSAFETLRSK